MKISILTLFPEMFSGPFDHSIVKHAQKRRLVQIELVNIRDFGIGKHKMVDDTPYGGGIGMVMRVDVLSEAIEHVKSSFWQASARPESEQADPGVVRQRRTPQDDEPRQRIILLSARGAQFNQQKAKALTSFDHIILVCGHYEGVDERIKHWIDEEISVGDFITTGGEIPAMLITDALVRLVGSVLKVGATDHESFSFQKKTGEVMLEYPHFTKPQEYKGMKVPDVLLSGNHQEIERWRAREAEQITRKLRPDLLKK